MSLPRRPATLPLVVRHPALLLAAALVSCTSPGREAAAEPAGGAGEAAEVTTRCPSGPVGTRAIEQRSGVAYAERDGQALRYDIAYPREPGLHPLVILLHGGSWSGGDRSAMRGEMLALAAEGYAAATVSYRLTSAPTNLFPAAIADVRCAVRHLRAHAADYDLDASRVAAAGYSAGAHLASLLGTAADVRGLDDDCPADASPRVQGVISYAGPQDLRVNGPYTREQADIVTNFLGVFPGDDPATAALASPIVHVREGAPPFLLVHGTDDDLVPVDHPRRMAAALRRLGTPATLIELPRIGHGFVGLATSENAKVRCTTLAFLSRVLRSGT